MSLTFQEVDGAAVSFTRHAPGGAQTVYARVK